MYNSHWPTTVCPRTQVLWTSKKTQTKANPQKLMPGTMTTFLCCFSRRLNGHVMPQHGHTWPLWIWNTDGFLTSFPNITARFRNNPWTVLNFPLSRSFLLFCFFLKWKFLIRPPQISFVRFSQPYLYPFSFGMFIMEEGPARLSYLRPTPTRFSYPGLLRTQGVLNGMFHVRWSSRDGQTWVLESVALPNHIIVLL